MGKEPGQYYCDVARVSIAPISKTVAKDIIEKYHYTHSLSSCRYALGIYYKSDEIDSFGNSDKLIGCAIYGFPVGAKAPTSVCEGLSKDNILELTRLFIHDGYGSNIESYALSQTFKWIRSNDNNIKVLISYADNGQSHLGGIYKATNWYYQGTNTDIALMPNYRISLTESPHNWIHSRTVFSRWGSGNLEHLKRVIGKEGYAKFYRSLEPPKHRYVMVMGKDRRERNQLLKRLKHPIKPYPTTVEEFNSEVEIHSTYTPEEQNSINFW